MHLKTSNDILFQLKRIQTTGVVAQEHSKKYQHLKMSVFRETFQIDYTVALTFTLT